MASLTPDRTLKRGHDFKDDPFKNFKAHPPKPEGPFRSFTRKSRYKNMSTFGSREQIFGSNSSMNTLSGSSQNLLDATKMMNMQDDLKTRKISAEVMKQRLYMSVISSPRRRRMSTHCYGYPGEADSPQGFQQTARMVQSMPVTPATSLNVTPLHSPTQTKKFGYGFFSRGTTPPNATPTEEMEGVYENEEDSWKGLACLFNPKPRYVPHGRWSRNLERNIESMDQGEEGLADGATKTFAVPDPVPPRDSLLLQDAPKAKRRAPSPDECQDV